MIYGTEGTILVDRNDYFAYDREGKQIKHESEKALSQTMNTVGTGALTDNHIHNFLQAIRAGIKLNAPVSVANISNHLCHLGNIAQDLGTPLDVDPSSGKVINNTAAQKYWKREYEKGWEPTLS